MITAPPAPLGALTAVHTADCTASWGRDPLACCCGALPRAEWPPAWTWGPPARQAGPGGPPNGRAVVAAVFG